jgi:hypothetical protein
MELAQDRFQWRASDTKAVELRNWLVRKSCKELCLEKNTQMSFSSSC